MKAAPCRAPPWPAKRIRSSREPPRGSRPHTARCLRYRAVPFAEGRRAHPPGTVLRLPGRPLRAATGKAPDSPPPPLVPKGTCRAPSPCRRRPPATSRGPRTPGAAGPDGMPSAWTPRPESRAASFPPIPFRAAPAGGINKLSLFFTRLRHQQGGGSCCPLFMSARPCYVFPKPGRAAVPPTAPLLRPVRCGGRVRVNFHNKKISPLFVC